jgi:methylated-DNA-[protein]-cysteine S-methyltransferase
MIYSTHYQSPLGKMLLASDGENLVGLWFEEQKYFAATISVPMVEQPDLTVFTKTKKWLETYFAGQKPPIADLPLAPAGSTFRQAVWKILCEIPYGECITYGDIARIMAKQLNKPTMSSQAVGGAVGHNPISVIIPCHRVIGSNGTLTGYAGGIDKKQRLLALESTDTLWA